MTGYRSETFVDGRYVPARSSDHIPLISPVTEQRYGEVVDSGRADLDAAVESAQAAFPDWSAQDPAERGALLAALADMVDAHGEELGELVTRENGCVIKRSRRSNADRRVDTSRRYAAVAEHLAVERLLGERSDMHTVVRREPYGVAGIIIPWNAPQALLASRLAPALAAGCTAVIKPSPETSLDAFRLAELAIKAGMPPGVINVVTGSRSTGAELVRHPGIDKVSFTGSTAAGRLIAVQCGELLKPLSAELGGKSAAVVLDDADLDLLARTLISTCLPNTGQVCYACTRLLAPSSRLDDVLEVAVTTLAAAPVGDPLDPRSEFGPLVSAVQRERVEGYIATGRQEGARLVLGGGRPASLDAGYFIEPTVVVDVEPDMTIFREEIFGPVLAVSAYEDEADALRLANASTYGLGGAIYGRDEERATDFARRMQTGSVAINARAGGPGAPRHGYKDSSVGGDPGLAAHLQTKAINRSALLATTGTGRGRGAEGWHTCAQATSRADVIVAAMKLGGVDNLFFVSGSELSFYQEAIAKAEALDTPAPRLVTMTHENVALNAALGNAMYRNAPTATAVHVDARTLHQGAAIHTPGGAIIPC